MRLSLSPTAALAVALAVTCVLLAAVAGGFAPAAAAAPDAAQIDDFLSVHGSPMTGTGATFAAEGREHGVDPAFLVAIAGAESSFGEFLYSENGDQCTYNAFNWFYGATWPQSDFGSWDEAIGRVAEGLSGSLYYGAGLYSVYAIAPRYCPDGTNNWIANVTSFMTQLGGDPVDTRLIADPAVPSSASSPAPQPAPLALNGAVAVGGGVHRVGDVVHVAFTISNRGADPAAIACINLVVRGPAGSGAYLVSRQPLSLEPGRDLT
ncbi:MAG: hypothetical protein NTX16_13220, partial [Actinobacteria bacterium]|nr:hypothetical protein [Actinomycetota bacterium]